MRITGTGLQDWAIRQIKRDYPNDVAILVEHTKFRLDIDQEESFCFYIPATNRANGLARTFIIGDGIGCDLFPMSWERVEGLAEGREDLMSILLDSKITYARSDTDRQRFESLQARLRANVQNPQWVYKRAVERLDAAVEAYGEMLFEEDLSKVNTKAAGIVGKLCQAVVLINHRHSYYRADRIGELEALEELPAGFTDLYRRIVSAKTADERKRLCHEMIAGTKAFLAAHDKFSAKRTGEPDFAELASWYQELSYTWRRIRHFCDRNDAISAFMWSHLLQDELDWVTEEFGVTGLDVFSAFDAGNLPAYRERANEIEQKVIAAIEAKGVKIDSYSTIEEFLEKNP